MSTVDELQAEVLNFQFSSLYATRIVTWLDEGHKIIYRKCELSDTASSTLTTTVGQNYVNLPSDFSSMINLSVYESGTNSNATPMVDMSVDNFDAIATAADQDRSVPYSYWRDGTKIYFPYEPDGVYSLLLRYWKVPTTLTLGTTPSLPAEYHHFLVDYALYRAYLSEHDTAYSREHKAIFDQGIMEIKGDIHKANEDEPKQVPGHWSNVGSSLPTFRLP